MTYPQLPPLFDPVQWWARTDGDRVAVVDATADRVDGPRLTYRALDCLCDRWHALLAAEGVQPGDRVAMLAQNRLACVALFIACIRRGAVLVPLNWRLSAPELARVLLDAEPVLLFGESRFRGVAEQATNGFDVRWLDLDHDVPTRLARTASHRAPAMPPVTYEHATMLLYTSGSTGIPKGVILPHRQLLWNALGTSTGWLLGPSDIAPAATPFFHTVGWHVFTTPLLFRGGTVVLMGAFDAASHLEVHARQRITMTFAVPTQLDLLQQAPDWGRPLPALRTVISGGAPCPQRTRESVRAAGYRIREAYGLTECGPNCFTTNDRTAVEKDGTVGWAVPFLEMRLRTADDRAATVDEVGELQLRGPQLFGGYFRAPQSTAEVMTDDGWLRTGDLASADAQGVYRIRGRRKEMFISGGENVFPGEVEAALLDCDGVHEAAVVGVPDERWGEVGCAVIRAHASLTTPVLLEAARARLAAYKVPRHVIFAPDIPKLGSGKIDRRAVLQLALAAMRTGDTSPAGAPSVR